ncbi:MAG: Ig-like domain-containing protein, partial [Sarcina sp.]
GSNSMFFTTEHWENWINVFTAMRKAREIQGKSLYINMTSYAVPSPWFLQWVEAVWLQNSNDVNFTGGMVDNSMMDAMINYRDDRYFDFVQTRQFQFPLANIYNHDPIYGNENFYNGSLVTMTTAQFEKYLYMIMTRGTGFWELYYSYNMFDNDKWMVNAEVLKWGQKNFSILRNAKLIGKTPNGGNVYGYSAWNGSKGIVSLRNPSSTAKSFTFTLDRLIGVGEGSTSLVRTTVYPYGVLKDSKTYNYGESITVTLQPYAVYIWQFGMADTIPAKVKVIKAITVNTVNVEFNERVLANKANYSVQGNVITNATILWDRRTVQLTLQNPLVEGTQYTLNLNNVSDLSNNMTTTSVTFKFYNNNQILKVSAISDLNNTTGLTSTTFAGMSAITFNKNDFSVNSGNSVSGVGDFTLSAIIKTVDRNTTILYQGSEYSLNINSTGNVEFNCKGILVVSKATINNNNWVHITALRERNGMVKIYINGTLDSSSYDATKTEENISSGTVMVGGTNFSGSISNLIITNVALGFDRIQSNAKAVGLN